MRVGGGVGGAEKYRVFFTRKTRVTEREVKRENERERERERERGGGGQGEAVRETRRRK